MTVTIMIDGSVKRNRKFGLKLQSSHVIEKRYNPLAKKYIIGRYPFKTSDCRLATRLEYQLPYLHSLPFL